MDTVNQRTKSGHTQGGFVLLYAILLTTVILTIALSLLEVLIQQVPLSGLERESSLSFYAADGGAECALYWDNVQDVFWDGSSSVTCNNPISCNGSIITPSGPTGSPPECSFQVNFSDGNCADVSVAKTIVPSSVILTTIKSKGYNTVCPVLGPSTKPWRLERGIKVDY